MGPLDIAHDDQILPSNENQTNADSFKSNESTVGNSSSEGSIGNSSSGSSGGSNASGGDTDDGDSIDSCDDDIAYDDDGKEAGKGYDPLWFVQSPRARQFVRSFYANNRAHSRSSATSPAAARRSAASSTAAVTSRIAVSPDDNSMARNPPQTSAPSRSVRSETAARRTGTTVTPDALDDENCDSRNSNSNYHASTLTTSSHRNNEVSHHHHHHSDNSSVGTGARRFTRTSALVTPPTASTAVGTTAAMPATWAGSAIAAAVEAASAAQQEEGSRMAARLLWPGIWALLPPHMPPLAVDLMGQLLMFDPKKRLKAHEALAHPWLESVRERGSYEDGLELESTLQEDVLGTSHYRSHRRSHGSGNQANQGGIGCSCNNSTNRVYTADIEALPVTSDAMRSAMQSEFDLFHTTQPREEAEEQ